MLIWLPISNLLSLLWSCVSWGMGISDECSEQIFTLCFEECPKIIWLHCVQDPRSLLQDPHLWSPTVWKESIPHKNRVYLVLFDKLPSGNIESNTLHIWTLFRSKRFSCYQSQIRVRAVLNFSKCWWRLIVDYSKNEEFVYEVGLRF